MKLPKIKDGFIILMVVFLVPLAIHAKLRKQPKMQKSDFRFGGGYGNSFYVTNQMDYAITTNYGSFKEIRPTFLGAIYLTNDDRFEYGVGFKQGSLLTLKSLNTQGSQCDFNEGQFLVSYSLNENAHLSDGRFTYNAQLGLGAINFSSMYFTVNNVTKSIDQVFSTVGYGIPNNFTDPNNYYRTKHQPNKQTAIVGSIGLTIGFRLLDNVSVYWENTLNISTSNKMSGNLYKKSWIPPDGYFTSALALYFRLGEGHKNRLGCPKF